MMSIYDDCFIDDLKKLTNRVHKFETNIILQLVYFGSLVGSAGEEIWGPSSVENLYSKVQPKEMTRKEIHYIQEEFAFAALRAKKAGFDGIQIHAAHGFLLSQFLTPYYNRRTDEYGGSIENRARMILETYSAIRAMVGKDYPIFIKINSTDSMEAGMTFDDCKYVCQKLAQAGVDAIEISGDIMNLAPKQEAYFKDYAAEIASENNTPIIVVGGNREYSTIESTLRETSIEYFSFSRPFIAEIDFVKRWKSGNTSRTNCTSCNSCFNPASMGRCILNKKK
jgi:2,4-dienoyl-CoA reductase-like NADH-dependent reductase (Old Yellow Enzyme family)